ncbi:MAG: type II secretion system protein GspK [Phycisphaerae bacterium]|nr:type II secretion system protein GspK [Phycisphaerae bacterium]
MLLITLVLLVILATLGYTVSSKVAARKHRDNYIIDYAKARYACDSGVKYAITQTELLKASLIERPNEPDFSDVFAMTEEQYRQYLDYWARLLAEQEKEGYENLSNILRDLNMPGLDFFDSEDYNDTNDANQLYSDYYTTQEEQLQIRGPYGPQWPYVTEPVEFEIGSAKVKIEIEDENAKYPLCWAMLTQEQYQREAAAGFDIFCQWMGVDPAYADTLLDQLNEINTIKQFSMDMKPIKVVEEKQVPVRSSSRSRRSRQTTRTVKTPREIPAVNHKKDLARLLHAQLVDIELLAIPTVTTESRRESPLKYVGTWVSDKVNVNTAPRHVLEAAFIFGGDAVEIADQIIERRKIKPFKDIESLRQDLLGYSDSIKKCENFITTQSDCFTIHVTAQSGVAQTETVIAVVKQGNKIERIGAISN